MLDSRESHSHNTNRASTQTACPAATSAQAVTQSPLPSPAFQTCDQCVSTLPASVQIQLIYTTGEKSPSPET